MITSVEYEDGTIVEVAPYWGGYIPKSEAEIRVAIELYLMGSLISQELKDLEEFEKQFSHVKKQLAEKTAEKESI